MSKELNDIKRGIKATITKIANEYASKGILRDGYLPSESSIYGFVTRSGVFVHIERYYNEKAQEKGREYALKVASDTRARLSNKVPPLKEVNEYYFLCNIHDIEPVCVINSYQLLHELHKVYKVQKESGRVFEELGDFSNWFYKSRNDFYKKIREEEKEESSIYEGI